MAYVNILGILILFALAAFALFQLYLVFCSSKYKVWKLRYMYNPAKYNQNFNVVIYSKNQGEAVVELLENLKQQNYPLDKVKINILLDNCTDNSAKLLEILGGCKLWRINTQEPMGRDAAFEWFLDRTLATENTNAFVFLDANNRINPYLLENINNAITEFPVVTGKICHQTENKLLANLIGLYEKLHYNIKLKGRCATGLSVFANTEILAVRQEVLEKIRFINIPNQNTGMLYSLLLAKAQVPILYSDEVIVFQRQLSTIKTFAFEKMSELFDKIKTLKYSMHLLNESIPTRAKELLLSVVYPNDFVMSSMFVFLIACLLIDEIIIPSGLVRYVLAFSILTMAYTFFLGKFSFNNVIMWPLKILTEPLMVFTNFIKGPNRPSKKASITYEPKKEKAKKQFKFKMPKFKMPTLKKKPSKNASSVCVTNGVKDIPCLLEIEEQDGLYASVLWFNSKKIRSNQFLRASDSLAELSEKLFARGFVLKVCQNCGYFVSEKDGKHDIITGCCLLGMVKHDQKEPYSTKISFNCKYIIPSHAREYVLKQLQDIKR